MRALNVVASSSHFIVLRDIAERRSLLQSLHAFN
jgi:hypothetical protein